MSVVFPAYRGVNLSNGIQRVHSIRDKVSPNIDWHQRQVVKSKKTVIGIRIVHAIRRVHELESAACRKYQADWLLANRWCSIPLTFHTFEATEPIAAIHRLTEINLTLLAN